MDTLTAMRVFAKVVHHESFTTAAEQLSLSRSSVSKHIAFLETQFSTRLLQRTTRRLSLTDAGRDMLERVEMILDAYDQLEGALQHARQIPRGRLRISAPYAFGTRYLGPIVADYQQRFSEVELEIVLNDRRVDLVEEGFDLALRIGDLDDSSLVARPLGSVGMTLCAAPGYLAENGTPMHPQDLARHRALDYNYARHGLEWEFCNGETVVRVRPQRGLRANSADVLRDVAIAGGGITLQPDFVLQDALDCGTLTAILADYPLPKIGLYAIYPNRTLMPTKLRTLIAHLQSSFNALTDPKTRAIRMPAA